MLKKLPYRNFKWIDAKELRQMEKDRTLIRGCTLEVDLDDPDSKEFHDCTNCYPLAPEHKVIVNVTKLVPNLLPKRRYVEHHRALPLYLKHGLILKKIHRGVRYEERDYVRSYIELNTKMRTEAKNEFEVALFKLMNNSVFGKQMENIRACSAVVIRSGEMEKGKKRLRKLIGNLTFKSATTFANSPLVSVNRAKAEVMLDKPIMVGQAILDISKETMYEFWYEYAKLKRGKNLKLYRLSRYGN